MSAGQEALAFLLAPLGAALALAWAWRLSVAVSRQPAGDARMRQVAQAIADGARAFLARADRTVGAFVLVLAVLLLLASLLGHPQLTAGSALAFVLGAASSLASGYVGMRVATRANVRTAAAAQRGLAEALRTAFAGGSVMGFTVSGLGLAGLALCAWLWGNPARPDMVDTINGFALGASSVALFARVAGGIFTKGADIGADLVGKVEEHIPEDDPRNPAVIADNVGDNVGDVAGMGADLFESYAGALVAAVAIAAATHLGRAGIVLPLALAGLGVLAAWVGSLVVHLGRDPARALSSGTLVSGIGFLVGAWVLTATWFHRPGLFMAVGAGSVLGLVIGVLTERATGSGRRPVLRIADAALGGPATAILEGLAAGMGSVAAPVVAAGLAILGAYAAGGLYGIALAAVGMLAPLAITLAVDAYGPIADNAGGIAEMAGLPPEVRARTDKLDALGNTTAAVGKGVAIGSAALTALALFAAYSDEARLRVIDLLHPQVIAGCLVGAALPYLFSALSIRAVGHTAQQMVAEVRRQFRSQPKILAGEVPPDYARCIHISTDAALRGMLVPGVAAVALPLAAGVVFGKAAVAGLLAGALVSGVALALQMSNSGGAMDNAKKQIEAGAYGGKGSAAHAAAVAGDTVGDPLKDTAGPSLNILIKLMSIVVSYPLMQQTLEAQALVSLCLAGGMILGRDYGVSAAQHRPGRPCAMLLLSPGGTWTGTSATSRTGKSNRVGRARHARQRVRSSTDCRYVIHAESQVYNAARNLGPSNQRLGRSRRGVLRELKIEPTAQGLALLLHVIATYEPDKSQVLIAVECPDGPFVGELLQGEKGQTLKRRSQRSRATWEWLN